MEITAKGIAALVEGIVEGDEGAIVSGFSPIEDARKGDLTFLANKKYINYIYSTHASAVLVAESLDLSAPVEAVIIRVKDPYVALARLMQYVERHKHAADGPKGVEQPVWVAEGCKLPSDIYLGAFSYIGKNVRVGNNVKIYPQCYLGDNVEIGDDVTLYPGVKIYHGCIIGNKCILHAGVVVGADGFGFAPTSDGFEKIPQIGNVVIEDNVEIGANTTIDRATFGSTRIGSGTKLDNLIQVAHNVKIGRSNVFAAQTGVAGSTQIGDGNFVGGQCGFAGHITVGSHNQIGAQSGIPNNVGDNNRLIGYPAVDFRQFAKNQVYIKKLGELFAEVKNINKK